MAVAVEEVSVQRLRLAGQKELEGRLAARRSAGEPVDLQTQKSEGTTQIREDPVGSPTVGR